MAKFSEFPQQKFPTDGEEVLRIIDGEKRRDYVTLSGALVNGTFVSVEELEKSLPLWKEAEVIPLYRIKLNERCVANQIKLKTIQNHVNPEKS